MPADPGTPLPDVPLVDQDDKPFRLARFKGHLLLITFSFTRCPLPDYCPLMMKHFAAIEKATANDASPSLKNARLLTVTHRSEHTIRPPVCASTAPSTRPATAPANRFSRWNLATGTVGRGEEARRAFSGSTTTTVTDRIIHSLRTAIVDPDGRVVKVFEGNEWTVDDVMRELRAAKPPPRRVRPNDARRAAAASACARVTRVRSLLLALIGVLMPAAAARADFLPSRPIAFWNDRLVISGDATLTIGQPDHGYFNSLDYYHDALNLARFGLSIELKAERAHRRARTGDRSDRAPLRQQPRCVVGRNAPPIWEPFETNRHIVRPYALFVRVRPFLDKPITVQAGRIPPVFGAFATPGLRRVAAAHQPAARVSLSDHAAARRGGAQQRRARALARRRLARPLPHRLGRTGARACRSSTRCDGIPACR